jgi:hypothetical protein
MKQETTQIHIYIDNYRYPDLAEKTLLLKNKRKLNKVVVELLDDYFKREKEQLNLFEKEKQS